MSIGHAQKSAGVLDLLAVQPARAEGKAAPDRARDGSDTTRGFEQALREASRRDPAVEDSPRGADADRRSSEREGSKPRPLDESRDSDRVDSLDKPDRPAAREGGTGDSRDAVNESRDSGKTDEPLTDANPAAEEPDTDKQQDALFIEAGLVAKAADQSAAKLGSEFNAAATAAEQAAASAQAGIAKPVLLQQGLDKNARQQHAAKTAEQNATVANAADDSQAAQPQAGAMAGEDTDGEAELEASGTKPVLAKGGASGPPSSGQAFTLPAHAAAESAPANSAGGQTTVQVNAAQLAAQATAQTQTLENTDSDAVNTARLTRGLANAVHQRGGAVTLRLTPPEMGTVRIQMQITGAHVSAAFHAETPSAQTLLIEQLGQLRHALENQGMSVDRLSVQPLASTHAGNSASQNQNDSQQQNQQNAQQQNAANDGRSRGQYSGDSSGRNGSQQREGDASAPGRETRRGFFDQLTGAAG